MPHFILDCSAAILEIKTSEEILKKVYEAAQSTNLFPNTVIKIRINPYTHYTVGGTKNDFIHVFGNIREGRNDLQKKELSQKIVIALQELLPEVPTISMDIREFEKESYIFHSMT